jgi:hypothetical protein
MAAKKTKAIDEVEKVKEIEEGKETILVFKANKPLDKGEFKLLSEMIKHEEKKTGVKIVLMPYSCDLEEK